MVARLAAFGGGAALLGIVAATAAMLTVAAAAAAATAATTVLAVMAPLALAAAVVRLGGGLAAKEALQPAEEALGLRRGRLPGALAGNLGRGLARAGGIAALGTGAAGRVPARALAVRIVAGIGMLAAVAGIDLLVAALASVPAAFATLGTAFAAFGPGSAGLGALAAGGGFRARLAAAVTAGVRPLIAASVPAGLQGEDRLGGGGPGGTALPAERALLRLGRRQDGEFRLRLGLPVRGLGDGALEDGGGQRGGAFEPAGCGVMYSRPEEAAGATRTGAGAASERAPGLLPRVPAARRWFPR